MYKCHRFKKKNITNSKADPQKHYTSSYWYWYYENTTKT